MNLRIRLDENPAIIGLMTKAYVIVCYTCKAVMIYGYTDGSPIPQKYAEVYAREDGWYIEQSKWHCRKHKGIA